MEYVCRQFMQHATRVLDHMGPQEWVVVLGAMIVVGCICLRGFGSRSQY